MAKRTEEPQKDYSGFNFDHLKEVWAFIIIFVGVFFGLSFFTYNHGDIYNYSSTNNSNYCHNFFGVLGAYSAYYPLTFLGIAAYITPLFCFLWGIRAMFYGFHFTWIRCYSKIILFVLLNLSVSSIAQILSGSLSGYFKFFVPTPYFGGTTGKFICERITNIYFGSNGSILVFGFLSITSVFFLTDGRPLVLLRWLFMKMFRIFVVFYNSLITVLTFIRSDADFSDNDDEDNVTKEKKRRRILEIDPEPEPDIEDVEPEIIKEEVRRQSFMKPIPKPEPKINRDEPIGDLFNRKLISYDNNNSDYPYKFPPIDLLDTPKQPDESKVADSLKRKAELLQRTLFEFGIEVAISEITRGPVITRYEFTLAPGTKVQKIIALEDDIALAMKTPYIRIVAPIPGKSAIGVEVPNDIKSLVTLKDLLCSNDYSNLKAELPLILGKDISGAPIISDLTSAPHLLIAGATGSGKSVCLNSIIISMLFSCPPYKLKFLMVDPKKVELTLYNDLPHILTPVITDAKKVSAGLNWVVKEMEDRYQVLADAGVRNIKSFNALPEERRMEVSSEKNFYKGIMPYIVVILDELADLMIIAKDEIEDAITRLAQLSRAVGIHLILATQRPSVNVITGVIKANFPVRISFKVSSKVDSRTVLDANGAEILLGNGDFLFLPPGTSKLIRGQGTYVSDKELHGIIQYVKDQNPFKEEGDINIFEDGDLFSNQGEDIDDELYEQAVDIVRLTKQASSSVLQRKLRIGYARAARLIDIMEANGVVGPSRGSKSREILIED